MIFGNHGDINHACLLVFIMNNDSFFFRRELGLIDSTIVNSQFVRFMDTTTKDADLTSHQ